MKAFEIFRAISPELNFQIFSYLQQSSKTNYEFTLQTLASQQKLRPAFVARKLKPERYLWFKRSLTRPSNEIMAINLLHEWLVGEHPQMLGDFLTALNIPHDGKGTVENIPAAPQAPIVRSAVEGLLAKHPAEVVAIYLHSFLLTDNLEPGWMVLAKILNEDERLKLDEAVLTS